MFVGTTITLKDYQHKPVLLEVVSLDDSSSVSRYAYYHCCIITILFSLTFCSMTWIEIGGTTYKLGGFVVIASDLFPEFAHIVDIIVTDKFKCFFICERYDTLVFNKQYHSYEVHKCAPCELIAIQQCDLIDFHVHTLNSISSSKFICPKYHIVYLCTTCTARP